MRISEDVSEEITIAAISTPPGAGGIGIVRMSGPLALPVLKQVFRPSARNCSYTSHMLYHGRILSVDGAKILDEAMAVYMKAPRSYTREDVVELHCHGSYLLLQRVLETLLAKGVQLAQPGEFTKRAFLNGRIDLTRAEAVIDVLAARTRKGIDLAQEQLAGALYQRVDVIRQVLARLLALIEVAIDFPDEDIEIIDRPLFEQRMQNEVLAPLQRLLGSADRGRIIREGVSVAIVGRPNVGKSSLLNALLHEERALVTDIPGTTRDTIEEHIDIMGVPVRIIDTAGIREGGDAVEEMGIARAKRLISVADIVLFMIDGAAGFLSADMELFETIRQKKVLLLINKTDLMHVAAESLTLPVADLPFVALSAREQTGIAALKKALFTLVGGNHDQWQEEGCSPNLRHKQGLERAEQAARRAVDCLENGLSVDLVAIELQECLNHLGDIVGETTPDDVLDVIFEQFCLGK